MNWLMWGSSAEALLTVDPSRQPRCLTVGSWSTAVKLKKQQMVNPRDHESNQVTFDNSPLIGPIPNLICISTSGHSSSSLYSITHVFRGCRNGRRDENSMKE